MNENGPGGEIRKCNYRVIFIAPVTFVTANDQKNVLEDGWNDYLSEPIDKVSILAL